MHSQTSDIRAPTLRARVSTPLTDKRNTNEEERVYGTRKLIIPASNPFGIFHASNRNSGSGSEEVGGR